MTAAQTESLGSRESLPGIGSHRQERSLWEEQSHLEKVIGKSNSFTGRDLLKGVLQV